MFKRMSLRAKIAGGFGCVSSLAVALGVLGYYGAATSDASISEIGLVRLPGVAELLSLKERAENLRGTLSTLGIPGLPEETRQRQYSNLDKAGKEIETAWKRYEALPHDAREQEAWQAFVPLWNGWQAEISKY